MERYEDELCLDRRSFNVVVLVEAVIIGRSFEASTGIIRVTKAPTTTQLFNLVDDAVEDTREAKIVTKKEGLSLHGPWSLWIERNVEGDVEVRGFVSTPIQLLRFVPKRQVLSRIV